MSKSAWNIGIDEVGRGPLAGPVVVCALAITRNAQRKAQNEKAIPLRDSKKLSAVQREAWCAWISTQPNIAYALARIYPKKIDEINITQAANLAATRALGKVDKLLSSKVDKLRYTNVLLDGGLYAKMPRSQKLTNLRTYKLKTIVKGDELYPAISLASIVAKVARDRYMRKLDKTLPQYGFATHKGYGTKAHITALKKWGVSSVHRKSFLKNFDFLRKFL